MRELCQITEDAPVKGCQRLSSFSNLSSDYSSRVCRWPASAVTRACPYEALREGTPDGNAARNCE